MTEWPKNISTLPTDKPVFNSTLLHPGKIEFLRQILDAFKKTDNRAEKQIWIFAFFDHAYHLKDWFKNFTLIQNFDTIWKKYSDNLYFKICRDFCNKNKHAKVSHPSISNNVRIIEIHENDKIVFYIRFEDQYIPAEYLMNKLVEFWTEFESKEI